MRRFLDALWCWLTHSGKAYGPVGIIRCGQCDRYIGDID